MKVWFVASFVALLFSTISCGKLVQSGNGNYAITGKGCGITTELKYLSEIPKNYEDYECVIILQPTNADMITSTTTTTTTTVTTTKTTTTIGNEGRCDAPSYCGPR